MLLSSAPTLNNVKIDETINNIFTVILKAACTRPEMIPDPK